MKAGAMVATNRLQSVWRGLLAGFLILAVPVGLAVIPNVTFGGYNFFVKAVIHIGMYAGITLFGSAVARWQCCPAWSGWLLTLAVSGVDEGLQMFSATRSASWGDWGFDLLGIIIGVVSGFAVCGGLDRLLARVPGADTGRWGLTGEI